jgi:hypothetical protein
MLSEIKEEPKKHRRGDVREDGMVFIHYCDRYTNGEYWASKEIFEKIKIRQKEHREKTKEKRRLAQIDWYKKNKEKYALKRKEKYDSNPEKYRKLARDWRELHRDKAVLKCKEWHKNNKEHSRLYRKKYYEENKDVLLENRSLYDKKFPEKRMAKDAFRRATLKKAIHPHHDRNDDKKFSDICKILKPDIDLHIDHIVPLNRDGIHHKYNLRLLPAALNISKNDRLDSELTPDQQHECYFWRILTRVLTASYDYEKSS